MQAQSRSPISETALAESLTTSPILK